MTWGICRTWKIFLQFAIDYTMHEPQAAISILPKFSCHKRVHFQSNWSHFHFQNSILEDPGSIFCIGPYAVKVLIILRFLIKQIIY